jgi:hypothetical protein
MHRDYVRQAKQSARGCPVNGHRELVTVDGVDSLLAKKPHQTLQACRIDRSADAENLWGYARSAK